MLNPVSPQAARIARKGAAFIAANDELTRAGHAAIMETSSIVTQQAARMFCAIHGPKTDEDEVEAGFDNLPL